MRARWSGVIAAVAIAAGGGYFGLVRRPPAPVIFEDWAVKLTRTPLKVADLESAFAGANYDFIQVRDGSGRVARVMVGKVPEDLGQVAEVRRRKSLFFAAVLPLVLAVNEQILGERATVERIAARIARGEKITAAEATELSRLARVYRVLDDEAAAATVTGAMIDDLLLRVAPLSVSLALAQAAEESAWGLSRFAAEGNALYGQWTWNDPNAMAPRDRAQGETHGVKAFRDLLECTLSYAHNINTHKAYADFRRMRANMIASTGLIEGHALAATLTRYSGRGQAYVESLRGIIRGNNLTPLDAVTFADKRPPTRLAAAGARSSTGS